MNTAKVLKYIAQHLWIEPDFTLGLPDRPAFTVPTAVSQRLQASDRQLQAGFLAEQIQTYLQEQFFSPDQALVATAADFANDGAGSTHSAFYQELERANPSGGYYDSHWQVTELLPDGWLRIVKEGLHLKMPITHLHPPELRAPGEETAIAMPKNLLTADRYIAVGDRGRPTGSPITNLYWHSWATTAAPLLTRLALALNDAALPFEIALLLDAEDYPRPDGVILRLNRESFTSAHKALVEVYAELGQFLGAAAPIGTKKLAPGVAVAESINLGQDFGNYLLAAIARGLTTAWSEGLSSPRRRLAEINASLAEANIGKKTGGSLASIHLQSLPDIYEPWS
jgi:hypothetical protein